MQLPHYHEDPHALHVGTQPARAYYFPAQDRAAAQAAHRADSPRFTLLNGEWEFAYYTSPAAVPDRFWEQTLENRLQVPSVWQNSGYDQPLYTNSMYPYPFDPPHVPLQNPCGAYVRRFTVTAGQKKLRQHLNFEGVDSCCYVWVNGRLAGYDQVSHCTGEFDITELVQEGENILAVLVLKWCDGSYLEDQDKFRSSGIFRDVYILHRPAHHLRDYTVRTPLTSGCTGAALELDTAWQGASQPLNITLTDPDGEVVWHEENVGAHFSREIPSPVLWNAETPKLYTLWLETEEETICERVGVREVCAREGVLRVNGQSVKFRGVNRHDSSPFVGPAVDREHMLHDLRLMKQHNINAIRTSHYPNSPLFVQMCDELGFYLIDEADQEAHGSADAYQNGTHFHEMSANREFFDAYVDRAVLLLQRDKNRPCVLLWSAGNESGWGRNVEGELAYFKKHDPTRLTHYESTWEHPAGEAQDFSNLDTLSQMYPQPKAIAELLTDPATAKKPYVLCEYSHAMGNGPGDLEEYYQTFERFEQSCGGFIWEWCDHAVFDGTAPDGRLRFLYGGDWNEPFHSGNFCMDGLVYPDRRPHTGLLEYKNVIRPGRVRRTGAGFTITNILDFAELSAYASLRWELTQAGKIIRRGTVGLPEVLPHATAGLPVELPADLGPDTCIRFILERRADCWYAPAGQELGFDQFRLTEAVPAVLPAAAAPMPVVEEAESAIRVYGDDFEYVFDKEHGVFSHIRVRGCETLAPVDYSIWRAPTDNDRNVKEEWLKFRYDKAYTRAYASTLTYEEGRVCICCSLALNADGIARFAGIESRFCIDGSGAMQAFFKVKRNTALPEFPRFGLRFELPETLENVSYLGYGPHESYEDKHRADWYGRFEATVDGLHEDYTRPQENGSHFGTRSLTLAGTDTGLTVEAGERAFSFNVSHYTPEMLTHAAHNFELEKSGRTTLFIDYRQNGIGSNSCGPKPGKPYLLDEADFSFGFALRWN